MKTLIAAALLGLAWSAPEPTISIDDDPPISCPFCGGGMETHQAILGRMAEIQVRASLELLLALRS